MTKMEKVLFLQQYQAGKRSIEELLPFRTVHFHNRNGIITGDKGKMYTEDELQTLKNLSAYAFFIMHMHTDIPIATCEEDVDLTPYNFMT